MDASEDLNKVISDFKIRGLSVKRTNKHPLYKETIEKLTDLVREFPGGKLYYTSWEIVEDDVINSLFYGYPHTKSVDYLIVIIVYMFFAFYLDDVLDKNPKDFQKWLVILKEGNCAGATTLEKEYQFMVKIFESIIPGSFFDYGMQSLVDWMKVYPDTQKCVDGAQTLTDQEYIEIRLKDIVAEFTFALVEFDSNLYDNNEFNANDDLIGLKKHAHLCILLTNDLFSWLKEVKSGHGRFNYVYVKMNNHNLTVEAAVDQIVNELKESESMLEHYGENLKKLNNQCLNDYVDGVIALHHGTKYWSAICKRYNYFEHKFFDTNNNII